MNGTGSGPTYGTVTRLYDFIEVLKKKKEEAHLAKG